MTETQTEGELFHFNIPLTTGSFPSSFLHPPSLLYKIMYSEKPINADN